jgi:hypothetical protein
LEWKNTSQITSTTKEFSPVRSESFKNQIFKYKQFGKKNHKRKQKVKIYMNVYRVKAYLNLAQGKFKRKKAISSIRNFVQEEF